MEIKHNLNSQLYLYIYSADSIESAVDRTIAKPERRGCRCSIAQSLEQLRYFVVATGSATKLTPRACDSANRLRLHLETAGISFVQQKAPQNEKCKSK